MRKKTTLSAIVLAAILAVMIHPSVQAQSRFTPPQKADGQGFKAPPRYLPPPSRTGQSAVQQVGYQEGDVQVPAILSGKTTAPAAVAPASGTAAPQQPRTPQQTPAKQTPPKTLSPAAAAPAAGDRTVQETPKKQAMQPPTRSAALPPLAPVRGAALATRPAGSSAAADPQALQNVAPRIANEAINARQQMTMPALKSGSLTKAAVQPATAGAENGLRTQELETWGDSIARPVSPLVSSTTTQPADSNSLIDTSGPKLRVTSRGPASISIGKTARFEILVQNLEARSAESVIVGIDFPEWVEITTTLPSTGSKETTDGQGESRMVWQIPIVEAAATEKIVLDVVPRESRPFDIDVEWTFKPIRGKTTVEVTQPQLNIQIAGPTEVQFGEKALYHVTVSNPGTGTAENVAVMLPEALGGERASLENIEPQQQKKFQVELIARSAGTLDLVTTVLADGNLKESDTREIIVRRAVLDVKMQGPPMKYAGTAATYHITVSNQGDAMARDVVAAVALPPGVKFLRGIDNVEQIDGGIRWNVGMLSPGNQRTYQLTCDLAVAGDLNIEAASRGAGDLAATASFVTHVDAVADLVLRVADPKGPLPTGENIDYEIRITNRGTRSARAVNIVMHFSEGVEPVDAEGIAHELAAGQVTFAPIAQIDPGQEIVLKVRANASQPGSHRFRAQLLCEESDSHEVAEGTTKFFGESITNSVKRPDSATNTAERADSGTEGGFKR